MRRIDSGDHLRHNHRQASQRRVSVIVTNGIISILAAVSSGLGEDFFGPVSSPEWRKEKYAPPTSGGHWRPLNRLRAWRVVVLAGGDRRVGRPLNRTRAWRWGGGAGATVGGLGASVVAWADVAAGAGVASKARARRRNISPAKTAATPSRLLVLRQQELFERRQDALRGFQQDGVF